MQKNRKETFCKKIGRKRPKDKEGNTEEKRKLFVEKVRRKHSENEEGNSGMRNENRTNK